VCVLQKQLNMIFVLMFLLFIMMDGNEVFCTVLYSNGKACNALII